MLRYRKVRVLSILLIRILSHVLISLLVPLLMRILPFHLFSLLRLVYLVQYILCLSTLVLDVQIDVHVHVDAWVLLVAQHMQHRRTSLTHDWGQANGYAAHFSYRWLIFSWANIFHWNWAWYPLSFVLISDVSSLWHLYHIIQLIDVFFSTILSSIIGDAKEILWSYSLW